MKKSTVILISILAWSASQAQFQTRIFNLYSDLPIHEQINFSSNQFPVGDLCFGANVCVGNQFLNTIAEYNFHNLNLDHVSGSSDQKINVHEFLVGLRFYPAKPTFMINRTALRLTLGCKGGWDINLNPRSMFFAGFGITGVRNPSGILVEGFYHRSKNGSQGYLIEPYYGIRIGLTLGPGSY